MLQIRALDKLQLDQIKPLWENLNLVHLQDSVFFKEHYASFSFEKRAEKWINTPNERIQILAAYNSENEIIGYCVSTICTNHGGEVDSLYVETTSRKHGFGKLLLEQSLEWLKIQQCFPIRLSVSFGHENVLSFYQKMGLYPRLTLLELKE